MPKISEIQLAEYVYDALVSNYSEQLVTVNDILGTQYIQPKQTWLVYTASHAAKAKLMGLSYIPFESKLYTVSDFTRIGLDIKRIRSSIHGIPMHVKNVEIEQWVSEYGELSSPVQCALVKKESQDSMFKHLYSGNRFCYVKSLHKAIPRYVIYYMPDPMA